MEGDSSDADDNRKVAIDKEPRETVEDCQGPYNQVPTVGRGGGPSFWGSLWGKRHPKPLTTVAAREQRAQ